mgnify:CR=1 FL=1
MQRFCLCLLFLHCGTIAAADDIPSVFELPAIQSRWQAARLQTALLFRQQKYDEAKAVLEKAIQLVPHEPAGHYNLACALARLGQTDAALDALERAVSLGFNQPDAIRRVADFASLKSAPRFAELVEKAKTATRPESPWKWNVKAADVHDGVATVSEANTSWNAQVGVFVSHFKMPELSPDLPVIVGHGQVGDLLRNWYAKGTAAGNRGDFYENHDRDHSNLAYQQFPQLTRIEYSAELPEKDWTSGLQNRFFFNRIVFGNSSTANMGPFWRSQSRMAYSNPRNVTLLYQQYVSNHLYVYPEHRDHDPAADGGHDDTFPANTPYLLTSQGSSSSDRVFLDAVACTLAAFPPAVKERLTATRQLMPAMQMIFRRNYGGLDESGYLTGSAHPSVFQGDKIGLLGMVEMAHAMTLESLPPLVSLQVESESPAQPGVDFFSGPGMSEKLFDTPFAIARVFRAKDYYREMVLRAATTPDSTLHWRVLRGDEKRIQIELLEPAGTRVKIRVPWHEPKPVSADSELRSSRVDIGCFAQHPHGYSAPAFVTWYCSPHEKRTYDEQQRIVSIDYQQGGYLDPALFLTKNWRDEYHYGPTGELTGWTRQRSNSDQEFNANGQWIKTPNVDPSGSRQTVKVQYRAARNQDGTGKLEQVEAVDAESQLPE